MRNSKTYKEVMLIFLCEEYGCSRKKISVKFMLSTKNRIYFEGSIDCGDHSIVVDAFVRKKDLSCEIDFVDDPTAGMSEPWEVDGITMYF